MWCTYYNDITASAFISNVTDRTQVSCNMHINKQAKLKLRQQCNGYSPYSQESVKVSGFALPQFFSFTLELTNDDRVH